MSKSTTFRHGDRMIRVESAPATIQFSAILDSTRVVVDECETQAPWEHCDGYKHTAIPVCRMDRPVNAEKMQGSAWSDSDHERVVIELDLGEDWSICEHHRQRGASRQVAREAVAAERRRTLRQLVAWYQNGWTWYGVKCELSLLDGEFEASVWGVDNEEYAETLRVEIAEEVAAQLEDAGYTVEGRPAEPNRLTARRWTTAVTAEGIKAGHYPCPMTPDGWREEYKRNVNAQNWHS